MRRRIFAFFLALVLAAGNIAFAQAEDYPFVAFTTVKLRLRKTPSSSGTVLAQMPQGEAVIVTGESGDYYTVNYEGRQGYAMKKYLNKGTNGEVVQTPASYETIQKGSQGDHVLSLQSRLQALGYYSGKVDGKCGTGTVSAIKNFQKQNGLKADGKAGSQTQALLFSANALANGVQATATPAPVQNSQLATYPYETTTRVSVNLRKGMSTQSARVLTIPKGKTVTVLSMDGNYLEVTYNKKTGYVLADYVNVPSQYLYGQVTEPEETSQYKPLSSGMTGDEVSVLQSALEELGFYSGTIDGKFGSGTQKAVKAFQKKNGLPETGVANAKTQQLMLEGKPRNVNGKKTDVKTLPLIDGISMELYDKGTAVERLQMTLQRLGYFHSTVSGVFDKATQQAVKNFQKEHGLYVDGKAGPKTQAKLNSIVATPTPVAATPSPTAYLPATMEPMTTPLIAGNIIVIHSGTRGMAVKSLQQRLMDLGYYTCKVDGIYDSDDRVAVRAFQKKNGLQVDGVAGVETQLKLYSDSAVHADAAEATATPRPSTQTTLRLGATGDAVKAMQSRLAVLGYLKGAIDGMYGTGTAQAVAAFQRQNDLKDDGVAGSKTLSRLYADSAATAPIAEATPSPTPLAELAMGSRGDAVRKMQQRLAQLGYKVSADGVFGTGTYNAVVAFQKQNKLAHDGIAGSATLTRLYSTSAVAAPNATVKPASTPSVSQGGSTSFTAPRPAEVRYANWYSEIRARAKAMPNVTLYDPETGLHYNMKIFSFGKHGECAPLTSQDTAIMNQICGIRDWTAKPVWVIFSDGRVYLASTHSVGHEVDYISGNNLNGHVCLHFPRVMSEAEATGPYAVSHQKAILKEWERIQSLLGE